MGQILHDQHRGRVGVVVTDANHAHRPVAEVNRLARSPVRHRATERRRLGRLAVMRLELERETLPFGAPFRCRLGPNGTASITTRRRRTDPTLLATSRVAASAVMRRGLEGRSSSDPSRTWPACRVARSRQGDRASARGSPDSTRVLSAADHCRSARNPHHKLVLSIGDRDSGHVSELTPVGQVLRSRR